jgi:amidase
MPDAAAAVKVAAEKCSQLGHDVEEIEVSYEFPTETFWRMLPVLSAAAYEGAAAAIGRPVSRADVEPFTWNLIERGRLITGIEHANDIEALRKFGRRIVELYSTHDVVITPTQPHAPRPLGTYNMSETDLARYATILAPDILFTAPVNFSGQPAITLPLYWTREGLPLGTQFIGGIGDEATLLRLAGQLEVALPWRSRRPPLSL